MESTHKKMTDKNFGDWVAAYTGGAMMGTYQWFNNIKFNIRFDILSVNWIAIAESIPAVLVAGFIGVIAKKGAEDVYAWAKKKLNKNKTPNNGRI